jgi:3-methyladenine DNA glycosylase AlkD
MKAATPTVKIKKPVVEITAEQFMEKLSRIKSQAEREKNARFFRDDHAKDNAFLGVRMGQLFTLAKASMGMSLKEIEKLLNSKFYEARMGGVCIMDFQARDKKTTESHKKELFNLYITKHNRINNWDMVDRSAAYVVGGYLFDKPRAILYKLAKSKNVWERRTAIVSTYFFIRQ